MMVKILYQSDLDLDWLAHGREGKGREKEGDKGEGKEREREGAKGGRWRRTEPRRRIQALESTLRG